MLDRGDAAGGGKGLAADQHAAAGRCCHKVGRPVHPREGVEHGEEIDEGRDQRALGKAGAVQPRHQADHDALVRDSARDKAPEIVGRMADIGVGQPQEVGASGGGDALFQRPELARPALRARAAGHHRQLRAREAARDVCRAIIALVIDQDDAEVAGIILRQHRAQRAGDDIGLVARRDDGDDRWPVRWLGQAVGVAVGEFPEIGAGEHHHQPDGEGDATEDEGKRDRHALEIAVRAEPAQRIVDRFDMRPGLVAKFALRLGG